MKHLKTKASFVIMIAMILFSSISVYAQDMTTDAAQAAKSTASNINWLIAGITLLLVFIIGVCSYVDEVDGSKTTKQGLVFKFKSGDQFVARLSGTGSSGATVR